MVDLKIRLFLCVCVIFNLSEYNSGNALTANNSRGHFLKQLKLALNIIWNDKTSLIKMFSFVLWLCMFMSIYLYVCVRVEFINVDYVFCR